MLLYQSLFFCLCFVATIQASDRPANAVTHTHTPVNYCLQNFISIPPHFHRVISHIPSCFPLCFVLPSSSPSPPPPPFFLFPPPPPPPTHPHTHTCYRFFLTIQYESFRSFYLKQIVRISHRQTGRDTERDRDRETEREREKYRLLFA